MSSLLLALLLSEPAHALTTQQSGPYVDLGVGLGLGDSPLQPGLGWDLGFGWWRGRYDDAYAIGHYWSLGATLRQDFISDVLHTAPMVEIRRGTDLIVLGWHGFLAGGPLLTSISGSGTSVEGGTARAGLGLELRRSRFLGVTLRLEGGADFAGGQVYGTGAALLGLQFSRPSGQAEES